PGAAISDAEGLPAQIRADRRPDLLDHPDDLVAEDARRRIRPASLVRVDVRPTDRGHRDPHERLPRRDRSERIGSEDEGRVRRLIHRRSRCPHFWPASCLAASFRSRTTWYFESSARTNAPRKAPPCA